MDRFFDPQLETKPDFVECMKRIYAWYDHQVLDRVPIRFAAHNAEYDIIDNLDHWATLKDRWYDTEYQVNKFIDNLSKGSFLGETFPTFWPNIGPNCFAGMLGCKLEFGEVTSWAMPCIEEADEIDKVEFNPNSEYLLKLNEMTDYALERCKGRYIVGYTDMHPGLDCVGALLGTQNMFYQMIEDEGAIIALCKKVHEPFIELMDAFHAKLKAHNQLSVTWMNIPSYETMHIPSCDHGAMISPAMFNRVELPMVLEEVKHFTHNIFHVDGKEVANHLDTLLEIPEIQGYQWVQGLGPQKAIMQWVPLIKKIQAAGKSAVVDLHLNELDDFMDAVRPEGILLCMDESDPEVQKEVLNKLLKWK